MILLSLPEPPDKKIHRTSPFRRCDFNVNSSLDLFRSRNRTSTDPFLTRSIVLTVHVSDLIFFDRRISLVVPVHSDFVPLIPSSNRPLRPRLGPGLVRHRHSLSFTNLPLLSCTIEKIFLVGPTTFLWSTFLHRR